jgi:hypothetical protein
MPTISLSDKLLRVLEDFVPGADTEAKLDNLARESLEHKLQTCNEALSRFEAKYGLTFADFARAWQEGKIPSKHSFNVERDFMEWEARQMEKEDLLTVVREFNQSETGS